MEQVPEMRVCRNLPTANKMKYCHCPNQDGKLIASDCEDCGGVVSNRIKSTEGKYWSLGCDILAGPKNSAVKIATAQMPETAKDIAKAMNLNL